MKLPLHIERSDVVVERGSLVFAGHTLAEIADSAGGTPFYIYSRELLNQRLAQLRAAMPAGLRLSYSLKANPNPQVVQHVAGQVDGLDVASAGELDLALSSGVNAADISFAGPGKTDAELRAACAAGVLVSVESSGELRRLTDIARAQASRCPVLLRVNPDFRLRAAGMMMGSGPQPFGIDAERVPAVLAELDVDALDFRGFHLFAGSQCLLPAAIEEMLQKGLALMAELAQAAPRPPQLLLLGGGFGVPYFDGEKALGFADIRAILGKLAGSAHDLLPEAQLQLELGRFLVAEAGFYVTRIVDRKVSRGQTFLVTDGGMHHNLAVSGNLGQVIRRDFPLLIGNRVQTEDLEAVTVVGPLCTPLDVLASATRLPAAAVGDLVVVFQTGAYGLSASPTGFLSHSLPAELLL